MFVVSELLDLNEFPFPHFFRPEEMVWETLSNLKPRFKNQPLGAIEGDLEEGVHLVNPELISIGKGTKVEAGSYIQGPCIIGKECQIRHGAYIRGHVVAGDGVVIGHATETKHSIFLNGSKAGHFAYVGDSILGHKANLGAGTKCANLRFDGENVKISGTDTGLRKFGAIFGNHSKTGCNVVTNPGTILLPHAVVAPCISAYGIITPRERGA